MEQICQDLSMEKVKPSDLPIISAPGIFRVFFFPMIRGDSRGDWEDLLLLLLVVVVVVVE